MKSNDYIKIKSYGLNKEHELTRYIIKNFLDSENKKIFKVIKKRKKGGVYRFKYKNDNYFLKFYSPKRIKNKIKNFFRKAYAVRVHNTAEKLEKYNINSLDPVVSIILQKNYFLNDSIFVSKEIQGENLISYIRKNDLSKSSCNKITEQMAAIWAKLINNNFLHLDPNLNNFMISHNDSDFEISLIDVDAITKYIKMPLILKLHATARFYAYVLKHKNFNLALHTRKYFSEIFIDKLKDYNLELNYFMNKMNRITLKRFIKENRNEILKNDPIMSELYKDYISK